MAAHYLMSSRNARVFCQMRLPFWTTSADLAIRALLMAISSIHIAIKQASQQLRFGPFRLRLSPNYKLFGNCVCLLHLSTQTTTAAASPSLSHSYLLQDGLSS